MPDTELKVGDVVVMKYSTSDVAPKFVVSKVVDNGSFVDVTWFDKEKSEFNVQRLSPAIFRKLGK